MQEIELCASRIEELFKKKKNEKCLLEGDFNQQLKLQSSKKNKK
jgi:hypothetical protein